MVYWRSRQFSFNATEARRRLQLATNMEPAFVGKFASGGTVNLEKLLQIGDGYVETFESRVLPIFFKKAGDNILGYDKISQSFFERKPALSARDTCITGLMVCGSNVFAFADDEEKWKPIDLRQISIRFQFADGKPGEIDGKNDLLTQSKLIVVLK